MQFTTLIRARTPRADWAVEIGKRDVRMEAEQVKTQRTTEEVSWHGLKKRLERRKSQRSALFAWEKFEADWEKTKKRLASLWRGKSIAKKAHPGRGQETKWEMSDNLYRNQAVMAKTPR